MPLRCPIGFVRLSSSSLRRGFTLIELLIVIGIVGALSAIVVVAINPKKQLCDAENARRKVMVREITNSLFQYVISTGDLPPDIPTSLETAKQICRPEVPTGETCVNLDVLVSDYVAALPVDVAETDPTLTGYKVYTNVGRPMAIAVHYDDACSGIAAASVSSVSSSDSSDASSSAATSSAGGGGVGGGGDDGEGTVVGFQLRGE